MESSKIIPRTLPGFMELSPEKQILFNDMIDVIKNSYEGFGFLPLDTPIIEFSNVLLAKAGGETEKQIYRFLKGDTDLSLRFDLTVPLAKYVAMNYNNLSFPFKRYQIGKVYRGERTQKGRFREFYQCDIDIIGDGSLSVVYDAEIPSIIYTIFKKLNIGNFTIYINNRKILNGLFKFLSLDNLSADIMRIVDKFNKIGYEKVKDELLNMQISDDKVNFIMDFICISGSNDEKLDRLSKLNISNDIFCEGLEELKSVFHNIKLFGVPDSNLSLDLKISRGLDYYTGTVYETFLDDYKNLGSICSGGRYDNLAEYYTDKKLPGVGISIGFTRLFDQLCDLNIIDSNKKSMADVLVVSMDDNMDYIVELSSKLRGASLRVDTYLNNSKPKSKFKYADKLGIPYVVVIGEDERANNVYTVKDMKSGEQKTLSIEELIEFLKK